MTITLDDEADCTDREAWEALIEAPMIWLDYSRIGNYMIHEWREASITVAFEIQCDYEAPGPKVLGAVILAGAFELFVPEGGSLPAGSFTCGADGKMSGSFDLVGRNAGAGKNFEGCVAHVVL
ncbi:MAG TPA: hypothetical protein VNA25_17840 [Phycisphaerae bacterium]|nr:hypothetical protein [Phycisphaerae bacterium]